MPVPQVHLTPVAKEKLLDYLRGEPSETAVRILVEPDGKFGLSLDAKGGDDVAWEVSEVPFIIEEAHAPMAEGLRVDFLNQGASSGFSLTGGRSPNAPKVLVGSEATPNPRARKFVLAFSQGEKPSTWTPDAIDRAPPLVREVLELEGVEAVFERADFVTVTAAEGAAWEELTPKVERILAHVLKPRTPPPAPPPPGPPGSLEHRVATYIRAEVAPFLGADGGDIGVEGLADGVLSVRLRGACTTCPSAETTLAQGVERRVRSAFPEVREVRAVG